LSTNQPQPEAPVAAPRISLRVRGMLALSVPIVALLGTVVAVLRLERLAREGDASYKDRSAAHLRVEKLRASLLEAESGVVAYLASGRQHELQPLAAARAAVGGDRLSWLVLPEDGGMSASDLQAAIRNRLQMLEELRASRGGYGRVSRERQSFGRVLDATLARMDESFDSAARERNKTYRQYTLLAIFCCCVGPFGGLLINLYQSNQLVRRLNQVGENAHLLAQGRPLRDLPGGNDEIFQLGHDMDEAAVLLSQREAGLKESEARFRQLFDEAPIPYHEAGCDGVIQSVNEAECRLLGYRADQIVGRAAWDFVAPEERDECRRRILDALATGMDQPPYESDYLLSDGSRITVEIHDNLIRGHAGELTGIRAALMDVTEHKTAVLAARKVEQYAFGLRKKNEQLGRAADAARAATEAKSRFLAGMSHELRTPLNSIIGFSELMHDGRVGEVDEVHKEFLSDILTSARHLLQLINDILDLSKIEAGKFEFRPESTDISRLAREVCDVISPLAAKRQIRLEIGVPAALPAVIDPARVKQVMYNYLSNAVKFTAENGRVTCLVEGDGPQNFRIEVEDTGVGISPEDMPRLFSEFEQLSRGHRPGQGAGLGLALTRRLVEGMGGKVGVRSVVGKGSVFSAVLPLDPAVRPRERAPGAGRSVLVVEDNVGEARNLSRMLRKAGYEVEVAYSRAEAASQCAVRSFDAITLDLLLPDASGWDLLRDIRSGGRNQTTPAVVISVAAGDGLSAWYPIQDCLPKPVQSAVLLEALDRAGVPPHKDRLVLVVDDDPSACRLMQTALQGLGYRAVCRPDGEAGLSALEIERPSAIVLDLVMPVVDGFEFLHRMRAGQGPQPPVIVWTSKDLSGDERRQLQALAEGVVGKRHCRPEELVEKLRALVG
jgi:PAS domain S-box-containing protein